MKIYAIINEADEDKKDLAYLFYYEHSKEFYIELMEGSDPWKVPLILSSFADRGQWTIGPYWSKEWVRHRIIPYERQNIGRILKDNKLRAYDEFALLVKAKGRCAQDDCCIEERCFEELPYDIRMRINKCIDDVVVLDDNKMLVFYKTGQAREYDPNDIIKLAGRQREKVAGKEILNLIKLLEGGRGIVWEHHKAVSAEDLWSRGTEVPFKYEYFRSFVENNLIDTTEACDLLNCSRQYINELVKTGKLKPVRATDKNTLFLKKDILERNW